MSDARERAARSPDGFLRLTLQQLITMAQTDIEANLPGAVARLPQSNLDALACMAAGMSDEQLEAIDFYATAIHITTAQGWALERHGSEWGIPKREATRTSGVIQVTVTAPLTIVEYGALFQTRASHETSVKSACKVGDDTVTVL